MPPDGVGDKKSLKSSHTKSVSSSSSSLSATSRGFLRRIFRFSQLRSSKRKDSDNGNYENEKQNQKRNKRKTKNTKFPATSTLLTEEHRERETLLPSSSSSIRVSESRENSSSRGSLNSRRSGSGVSRECPICFDHEASFTQLLTECEPTCEQPCKNCFKEYVRLQLDEGKAPQCLTCEKIVHPADVEIALGSSYLEKYEKATLNKYLRSESDARWCPRAGCGFAVIAPCAGCPELDCQKEGCGTKFCYHCKNEWHPNKSCPDKYAEILPAFEENATTATMGAIRSGRIPERRLLIACSNRMANRALLWEPNYYTTSGEKMKECPKCGEAIIKADDGSCNHMTCKCGCEFCWLCMKEISDLHYLSPSGCTFWGKEIWSKKKIIIWQCGILVFALPVIGIGAAASIPLCVFGLPFYVAKMVRNKMKKKITSRLKLRALTVVVATGTFLVSPIVAGILVVVGVPLVTLYVYGVIPITLCRTGGCGMCVGVRLPCLRQRTAASPNQTAEATGSGKKVSRTQTAAAFRLPSVNQSDDFSVQSVSSGRLSVTCLGQGSPSATRDVCPGGDIASTTALASFNNENSICSNSINGSVTLQSHENYNSTSASISSKGKSLKMMVLAERAKTPSISEQSSSTK